ncbi:MAG TPA: YHS domain-containing protein [Sporichthyaceae bacterium]|jgi:xanthine dehydrogenase accessory factor|nr:YHS domain-containing protein [Sporichthyaceae bacterium]
MSRPDVQERARELRRGRVPFVHARVVRAEKPTSARPGDEAIVLSSGTMEGFVGGTCAEATVRAQALALLDTGSTLMLRITPNKETERQIPEDMVLAHNPCLSGGALEIFLEAVVPPPLVVIHGEGPVAMALHALGKPLGFQMDTLTETQSLSDASAVIVAAHGRDEEGALQTALAANVPYVGLVASPKRGKAVLQMLNLEGEDRNRVHSPAGMDIGAVTAEEVALSILTEIVALRPRPSGKIPNSANPAPETDGKSAVHLDPVCGMSVQATNTALHLDHGGERYWFCGSGCLRAFSAEPTNWIKESSVTGVNGSAAAKPNGSLKLATDVVCGMSVAKVPASLHQDVDDERYWFCGPGCLDAFTLEPTRWIKPAVNGVEAVTGVNGVNGMNGSAVAKPKTSVQLAVDPVCGMSVAEVPASLYLDLDAKRYWFCGSGCLNAFSAEPAAWVKA